MSTHTPAAVPENPSTTEPEPLLVIEPSRGWAMPRWAEVWTHRELLYFLVWRDVKARYKQTALGAGWAILQPVLTMVVFSLVFGRFAQIPSDGLPYPIFTFSALLPWQLFAYALSESGNSLVTNQGLVTKVYFPRLVIPMAPVLSGLVDFSIAFVVLAIMMVYYGIVPGPEAMALPLLVAFASIAAFAVGLWLSALNARYRDVRYTIPFLTQVWLFATPIAYPASLVPEQWRLLYALNPMVVVVEGFRWALLGRPFPFAPMVVASVAMTLLLLLGGALYFRRVERTLADIV